jgi:hypothetical protein
MIHCLRATRRLTSFRLSDSQFPCRFYSNMMSSRPARTGHGLTGAFCLLAVVGLIAPSTVKAGCGHYVTASLNESTYDAFSGSAIFRLSTARVVELTRGGSERHLPCTGPSCSSERQELPPPHAPSSLEGSEAACWATFILRQPDLGGDGRWADLGISHPRTGTFFIERPPRASHPHPVY